ncbi:unnamed protein product [Adineta ricciae]|uniref:Peptidase C1A papain C-terminal domain-containing protein n=1 Tax=Adineta ricciae TaxID=249248 RepID=A0A816EPR6_ADIRI|nr:unnamed protein product [Adineta ricciae]
MKSCLAQGFPFAFGLRLYRSFDRASTTGVVPMPNTSERIRSSHGSHALLAVGYSDHSRSFIVRNSWGADWGDQGYCYIPYDYMTNPELCFDAWAVRKLSNDSFGKEHWDNVDAINYLKAAVMELMSMDNGNDDDNLAIEQVAEDDEPNQDQYGANSGYQHHPWPNNGGGFPPPPPAWHQPHGNPYQGNNMPPYHNQPQPYGGGYGAPNYQHQPGFPPYNNSGGYFPNQYQNNFPPVNPNYPNNFPPHPASLADFMNSESQNQPFGMAPNYNRGPYNNPNQY